MRGGGVFGSPPDDQQGWWWAFVSCRRSGQWGIVDSSAHFEAAKHDVDCLNQCIDSFETLDPPHEENMKLVKRLIGLPGDTLEMKDKVLYLNGLAQDEPYVQHTVDQADGPHPMMAWQRDYVISQEGNGRYQPTRDNWGPLVIPPEHFFMMGDNRDTSLDSRYWGLLDRWRFEGRAVVVYFSYNKDSFRPFPWLREIRWRRIGDRIR